MNDTLTEVLLAACVTPTLMPDRLLMEHVLLVSILHHAVGLEVKIHNVLFQGFLIIISETINILFISVHTVTPKEFKKSFSTRAAQNLIILY